MKAEEFAVSKFGREFSDLLNWVNTGRFYDLHFADHFDWIATEAELSKIGEGPTWEIWKDGKLVGNIKSVEVIDDIKILVRLWHKEPGEDKIIVSVQSRTSYALDVGAGYGTVFIPKA